jgi:hypothetical protein
MPIDNAAASAIDVFGDNLPFSPFTNHLLSSVPQEWREMPNQATDLQVGWPSGGRICVVRSDRQLIL